MQSPRSTVVLSLFSLLTLTACRAAPFVAGPAYDPALDAAAQPREQTWTLTHEGRTRRANVHLPPGYDGTQATPVVLNFHGMTSNPTDQQELSRMNPVADAHGFVVVYPEGVGESWNAGGTCCSEAFEQKKNKLLLTQAQCLLVQGRTSEAGAVLARMSRPIPWSYRLLASLPGPVVRGLLALRRLTVRRVATAQ